MDDELQRIIKEVEDLKESKAYRDLYNATKSNEFDIEESTKWTNKQVRMALEASLLKGGTIGQILSMDSIKYKHAQAVLTLCLLLYFSHTQRKISLEDAKKVFNIYERVLTYLEDFDKYENPPPPTIEFYEKLKKVKWSKEAKEVRGKIRKKENEVNYKVEGLDSSLGVLLIGSTELLAAISAVKSNRDIILPEDVFRAYKTFFKLLNTDITKIGKIIEKSDEEIDKEFESLGTYKGFNYLKRLNELRRKGEVS